MSREQAFIDALRAIARDPAARGLTDDAAVLPAADGALVLTHDMIVEGVHFLRDDPPADVAWKLVAVNLSDLAAKGARPLGLLLGYPLGPDAAWDRAFAAGLDAACRAFGAPLLGGDTVALPPGSARQLGMTAIGAAPPGGAPARSGARAGDTLYVTGTIGAAGLGLRAARGEAGADPRWLSAYRRPQPRLAAGQALAARAHAMADVSDGLLIDAARMAAASGVRLVIDLTRVPIADGYPATRDDRLAAASAGDDYELLVAGPQGLTLPQSAAATLHAIGWCAAGQGLGLVEGPHDVPLPARLGYEHDG